tara:strand:+ start:4511 stop:5734 length:1224 start_codon:yes stop_codon:yes gene_type:complete
MIEKFGSTYITSKFKEIQRDARYNKEMALLPSTQPDAERHLRRVNIKEKIKELKETKLKIDKEIFYLYGDLRGIDTKKGGDTKINYVWPCPIEECKGFLNTSWTCGLCSNKTCKDCLEIITDEEDHECKEELKLNATVVKENTKPCPGCGTGIFKSSGCSQMYCTNCNTAFDWRTGKIEQGRIHNPHYYEYLRNISENGEIRREEENINACDALVINRNMERTIAELYNRKFKEEIQITEYVMYVMNTIRYYGHMKSVYNEYNREIDHLNLKLKDYRINILLKHIKIDNKEDKVKYLQNINKHYKQIEFYKERILIVDTVVSIVREFIMNTYNVYLISMINNLRNLTLDKIKKEDIDNFKKEVNTFHKNIQILIKYCIKSHDKLANTYNSVKFIHGIEDGLNLFNRK